MKGTLYTNNLKNGEFGQEAAQNPDPILGSVLIDTARGLDQDFEGKPRPPKTNSSGCLCIDSKWLSYETIAEAQAIQKELAKKVLVKDEINKPIKHIGGVDVSNTPFDSEKMIFGAVTVCSYPSLCLIETVTQANKQKFPYVPGLLGFREVPTLIQAYKQLSIFPDILMVDGHGVSHPRGLGIASHLGVLLDIPTIGVAKSILIGKPAAPLSEEVGSMVPLLWKGKEIGMIVRTKKRCLPLILSAGHKISLETAIQLVISCLKKHRLPEPTRYAHLAANQYRQVFSKD